MEMFFLSYVNDAGGCDDRRAKHGQEEPPHVQGQGQKPGGPHAQRAEAKSSYPTSEVRGSSREYQTATGQERPRGATPRPRSGVVTRGVTLCPRSGGVAGRSNPHPRPGAVARRTNPMSKKQWLPGCRRA